MQGCERLRSTLRTLTPSELDGINELKLLFANGLDGASIADLRLELQEIECQAEVFGERLENIELRAELEILLARFSAVLERLRVLVGRQPVLQ